MTSWSNWSGSVSANPAKVERPRNQDELAKLVRDGLTDRVIAARLGGTRLLDNIAIDLSGTTGPSRAGGTEPNEINWRN